MQNFRQAALHLTKKYINGYSEREVKVLDATSNAPGVPSGPHMHEIALMTFNRHGFVEVMEILDKRLSEIGKNWRCVYKSLLVLIYILPRGSESVLFFLRNYIESISILKTFGYVSDDGRDYGNYVRLHADKLVTLVRDDPRHRERCRDLDARVVYEVYGNADSSGRRRRVTKKITLTPEQAGQITALKIKYKVEEGKNAIEGSNVQQSEDVFRSYIDKPYRDVEDLMSGVGDDELMQGVEQLMKEVGIDAQRTFESTSEPHLPLSERQRRDTDNDVPRPGFEVNQVESMDAFVILNDQNHSSYPSESLFDQLLEQLGRHEEQQRANLDETWEEGLPLFSQPRRGVGQIQQQLVQPHHTDGVEANHFKPMPFTTTNPHQRRNKTLSMLVAILNEHRHYQSLLECSSSDAQIILELCQMLLDSFEVASDIRRQIVTAMQRLAAKSKSFPSHFFIHGPISLAHEDAISSGSFGDIYKATLHAETLCLKVLRANRSILEKSAKSFAREAILWSQLSHPNVLPFYGLHVFRSQLSFVSPWAENGNIMEFLAQQILITDRLLLCLDTAMGVEYLHAKGVVHGDIKSANVLVDRAGRAYLADFGLSNIDDPEIVHWTSQSSVASKGGSARWQAPELHRAESDFEVEEVIIHNTEMSDVFAWGCLCYEIFTGRLPFYAIRLPTTVVLKILEGQVPMRPQDGDPAWIRHGLTEPIWKLMEICWKFDRMTRPKMPTIVLHLNLERNTNDSRPTPQWPAGSAVRFRNTESVHPTSRPKHTLDDFDTILSRVTGLGV
ncbi:hypothetical protein DXG01_002461 [Tephrocybe rancida]|nr:hypothetical protein DXG01_002461 [Tephrocybe rancida]